MAEGKGDQHDKTEAASPKRRDDARRKGNLLRSRELTAAFSLAGAAILLHHSGPGMWRELLDVVRRWLELLGRPEAYALEPAVLCRQVLTDALSLAAPLGLGVFAFTIASHIPGGLTLQTETLMPKLSRMAPGANISNVLGLRGAGRLVSMAVKAAVIALVSWTAVQGEAVSGLLARMHRDAGLTFGAVIPVASTILTHCAVALLVLSLGDLAFAWFMREREMRMTRQEVKDETKEDQGDPEMKMRIRRIQREQARRRMATEVPKATVVITNPTHFAVALRYERDEMAAPVVVAKGVDLMAQQIKRIAGEAGVPIVEERPLARALYGSCEVGAPIPDDLFQAVARILAHVMQIKKHW